MTARAAVPPMPLPGRALALAGLLALWEGAARLTAGSYILAGPGAVLNYASQNAGLLWRALGETAGNAAWGFLWGNLAAGALAVAVILLPRLERGLAALALLVFCLPLVATGPILRILMGPGAGPQIALAALAVQYTTFLALLVGLRAVPQSWLDLVASHGRGRAAQLLHVRAAAALPYAVAGLRIAAPAAFLGAMIGEFTGAERGLGVLTLRAMGSLDVDATWTVASLAAAISIASHAALGWLGRRMAGTAPALLLSAPASRPPAPAGRRAVGAVALVLAPLLLWQGAMQGLALDPFFAKRPADVLAFLLTDSPARATLLSAWGETLAFAVPGYLAGLVLGAGLACAVVVLPWLSSGVMPVAVALRSVPIVTTAPLLVLAFGRGAAGTVAIVAAMIFFPTLVACLQGLRQAPGPVIDIFDSYAAGRWRTLLLARLPATLPAAFAAARMGVPAAILAVTTAEWLATGTGIGSLMALTASTSDYLTLWSAIALIGATSAAGYAAIARLERAVLRHHAPEQVAR